MVAMLRARRRSRAVCTVHRQRYRSARRGGRRRSVPSRQGAAGPAACGTVVRAACFLAETTTTMTMSFAGRFPPLAYGDLRARDREGDARDVGGGAEGAVE